MKKQLVATSVTAAIMAVMVSGSVYAADAAEIMSKYQEASKELKEFSATMDMDINGAFSVAVNGETATDESMEIKANLNMGCLMDSLSISMTGDMTLSQGDETIPAEFSMYMLPEEDGSLGMYIKAAADGNEEWQYEALPADQVDAMKAAMDSNMTLPESFTSLFTLGDEMTDVNGISCYPLTAAVTYADLKPVIEEALATTTDAMSDEEKQNITNVLSLAEMASVGLVMNIEIDVAEDTYYPQRFTMDMNGSDYSTLNTLLAYYFGQTDADGNMVMPDVSLSLDPCYMEAVYDYTTPVDVTLPDEAVQAKENAGSSDGESLQDLVDEVMTEIETN